MRRFGEGSRRVLLPLAFLAVLGMGASSAFAPRTGAAGPQSLDLANAVGGYQSSAWIEQQDDWPMPASPITNPVPSCTWSVNDHSDWTASGFLDPGGSTSRSSCVISDFNPVLATRYGTTASWQMAAYGFAGLLVQSPSPDLTVFVCYQPQARCFVPVGVWLPAAKVWQYRFCGRANYQPNDPTVVDIAGSNGGRGVVTTVTMTVTNPTTHRLRNLYAAGGFSSDIVFPSACNPVPNQTDYPFTFGG